MPFYKTGSKPLYNDTTVNTVAEDGLGKSENSDQTYTVEQAIEGMGFGRFQVKVFVICGLFAVSTFKIKLVSIKTAITCICNHRHY